MKNRDRGPAKKLRFQPKMTISKIRRSRSGQDRKLTKTGLMELDIPLQTNGFPHFHVENHWFLQIAGK